MYKVFFNERIVLLTDDFINNFQLKDGLFYKFREVEELKEIISVYWELKLVDKLFIFHNDICELQEKFKTCFKTIQAAGGLVRNNEGKYLFINRRDKWDLPKGKINVNEAKEDAAIREVNEECGLNNLEIINPLLATYHSYLIDNQLILKKTSWFEMFYHHTAEPVPQQEEEITEAKWFKKDDLSKIILNTYPSVIDVLHYSNLL
jgi:8-oxo-dGTP pyrophosphatase MutT (NUDIX family)